PERIEFGREVELHTTGSHQHDSAEPLRVPDCEVQCESTTERVADHVHRRDLEAVEESEDLIDPGIEDLEPDRIGKGGVSEADQIGSDHSTLFCEDRDQTSPVGPRRDAGAGTVEE